MKETESNTSFKLDAPDEYRDRMTADLERAPTYVMTIQPGEHGPRIISLREARTIRVDAKPGELTVEHLSQRLPENLRFGQIRESRYETKTKLGEGGVGEVYEAIDHNVNRPVAIKVLKDDQDPECVELFLHEGALAAEMEHPNIVPVYDMDVDANGSLFMSMKKIDGRSLESVITDRDLPAVEELVPIFLKLCDALRYAHNHERVHQDIKPANVMLGNFGEVFLIDWGSASESGDQMQLSPVYMSPEQAQGMPASPLDDVYCLGATMFHALTGRYPTNAETIDELWNRKVAGTIDPPTEREYRRVAPALLAIAMKAMAPEIEDRYPTIDALSHDLTAFQNGYATSAENAGMLRLLQLLVKRRWKEVALTACIAAAVVAAGIAHAVRVHRAEVARLSSELEVAELEKQTQARELEVQRLERQRHEQWLPFLAVDFAKGGDIDARLSVSGTVDTKGLHVGWIGVTDPIPTEFLLESTFVCGDQPSLKISISKATGGSWRSIEIDPRAAIYSVGNGWIQLEAGPTIIRQITRTDALNHLKVWQSQGHWHVELNGRRVLDCYDPSTVDAGEGVKVTMGRALGLTALTLKSLSIRYRQPPEYLNVLATGKTLMLNRQFAAARAWFKKCSQLGPRIADEAAYLFALSNPGIDPDSQYEEFKIVASNKTNAYRLDALKRMVELSFRTPDMERSIALMEGIKKDYPNWQPESHALALLARGITARPPEERAATAQRVANISAHSLHLAGWKINRLPAVGTGLSNVDLSYNQIDDIANLRGLPLDDLNLSHTEVTNLEPLRGMNLKTMLLLGCKIGDLSALTGMRMETLVAKYAKVPIDLSTISDLKIVKPIFDGSPLLHLDGLKALDPRFLRLSGCGLTDLEFVSNLTNVKLLRALNNEIESLHGLEGKTLDTVGLNRNRLKTLDGIEGCVLSGSFDVSENPLADISPLNGQPLKYLLLNSTNVTDLSVVRTLPELKHLSADGDPRNETRATVDLGTLGPCSFETLRIRHQKLSSLEPLASCTAITSLDVQGNPITDLSPIAKHPIRWFNVLDTAVADLTQTSEMSGLKELYAGSSDAEKPSPLTSLAGLPSKALKQLNVSYCPVRDLSPLINCRNLRKLSIEGLSVTDYSPILELPLTHLKVGSPGVDRFPSLSEMKTLKFLTIEGLRPNDPAGLSELPPTAGLELTDLNLKNNRITDVTWLKATVVTRRMDLSGNPIVDVSPLKGQPIVALDLSGTAVTDLSVIKTLPKLTRLTLRGVPLSDSAKKVLASLGPAIKVSYE